MGKYFLAPLLISKLGQNDSFRLFFSRLLKVLAIVGALAAIIVFFLDWKDLFEMSSEGMIGGILYQLTFVAATYLAVHCTLLRAAEVKESVPGRPPALSVAVVVLKLAGETWGFASALFGIGGAIYVWFAGREAEILLKKTAVFFPFLKAGPASFTGGAALIVQGLLYGVLALLLGYLLSELLLLLPVDANSGYEVGERLDIGGHAQTQTSLDTEKALNINEAAGTSGAAT
jgi:hypothetical protein